MKIRTRALLTPSGGLGEVRSLAGPPKEIREGVEDLDRVRITAEADQPFEVRAEGDGSTRQVVGHAAVFDRLSEDLGFPGFSFREQIKRGAFRKSLDNQDDVRLLINHDGLPLARTKSRTLELREDPRGLRTYAEVDTAQDFTRDLVIALERGDVDQMSFGFTVAVDEWVERHLEDGGVEVIRTIVEIDRLFDVSVVTFPAYPQTDVQVRSGEPAPTAPAGEQDRNLLAARRRRLRLVDHDRRPVETAP